MTRRKIKQPQYLLPNELYPFDLVMMFREGQKPSLHYDKEMQMVFDKLVKDHGTVLVKVNWSSLDLHLIIPPKDLAELFTSLPQQDAEKAI